MRFEDEWQDLHAKALKHLIRARVIMDQADNWADDEEDEPEYTYEAADGQETQDFQPTPSQSLSGSPEGKATGSPEQITSEIQTTISTLEDTPGLQQITKPLSDLSQNIQNSDHESEALPTCQLAQRLERLEQALQSLIQSVSVGPPTQIVVDGTTGSKSASEPLTPQARRDLALSKQKIALEQHWAGMDSLIQTFLQWRSSVNVSSPSYALCREEWLEKNGVPKEKRQVFINAVKNKQTKKRRQRALKEKKRVVVDPSGPTVTIVSTEAVAK